MNTIVFAAGIGNPVSSIIDNWLGPAFLLFVAACAITFIKDREFRKLFSYVGIATVVALLISAGNWLFGKDGKLKKAGENIVEQVN